MKSSNSNDVNSRNRIKHNATTVPIEDELNLSSNLIEGEGAGLYQRVNQTHDQGLSSLSTSGMNLFMIPCVTSTSPFKGSTSTLDKSFW